MLKAQTIRSDHADVFSFLQGNLAACASGCHTPDETGHASLVFVSRPEQLAAAIRLKAAIIVVHRKIAQLVEDSGTMSCCFAVSAIPTAMTVLLKYFDHKAERFTQWGTRHPTALVHPMRQPSPIDARAPITQ